MRSLRVVCLLLLALPALAQDGQSLLVRVNVPSGVTASQLPVLVDLNLPDIKTALKLDRLPPPGQIPAFDEGTRGALPAQFATISDGLGRLCLFLPTQPAGERLVKVYFGAFTPVPDGDSPMRAEVKDNTITITNAAYTVTHDGSKNGGLPSRLTFPATGKVFDTFSMNDRLHSKEIGGFRFDGDPAPRLELMASGPLYTEVRVEARYMQGGKQPPSAPRGVYTFSYFANSPLVRVTGEMSQNQPQPWNELHFLEMYFKDDSFTTYATGNPPRLEQLKDEKKGASGADWGALMDGKNAIGMLTRSMIYDGKGEYGRYLHGPWVPWDTETARFSVDLWIGTADDPLAALAQASTAGPRTLAGTAFTPRLLADLDRLRTMQPKLKPTAANVRPAWLAGLIESSLVTGKLSLLQAEQAATKVAAEVARGEAPSEIQTLGAQRLQLVHNDEIGLALARETGVIRLVSLRDLKRGRELLAEPCDLFRFTLKDAAGKSATVGSNSRWLKANVESNLREGRTERMLMRWEELRQEGVAGLEVDLVLTLDGPLSKWKLSIANTSPTWGLDRVTLPALKIGRLGDDISDDRLLVPNGFGRAYPVTANTNYSGRYPDGGCAMQWMGVCDDESGVYVAQHDPTAATKMLMSSGSGTDVATPLAIEVPVPDATVAGVEPAQGAADANTGLQGV